MVCSECGPANWFAGRVLDADGKWTTIDEAIDQAKANKQLDEYEAMRSQLPASVQGNWQAARWCAQQRQPPGLCRCGSAFVAKFRGEVWAWRLRPGG